ncbi:MAG: hypothetical protein AABX11_02510 [Nanoarchaeota archaeon]
MSINDRDRAEILKLIRQAKPDSDIHGVLERVAYGFHITNKENSADANWFDAQEKLARYEVPYNFDCRNVFPQRVLLTEGTLRGYLQKLAYYDKNYPGRQESKNNSAFDFWMRALDVVASQVLSKAR